MGESIGIVSPSSFDPSACRCVARCAEIYSLAPIPGPYNSARTVALSGLVSTDGSRALDAMMRVHVMLFGVSPSGRRHLRDTAVVGYIARDDSMKEVGVRVYRYSLQDAAQAFEHGISDTITRAITSCVSHGLP